MAKKDVNDKKQSKNFFKEMKGELKKVVWPTPKELFNNTCAVIGFVLIIGIIVFVLDFCFENVNKYGIVKFQEKIQTTFKPAEDNDNSTEGEAEDSSEDEIKENIDEQTENQDNSEEESVEVEKEATVDDNESNE